MADWRWGSNYTFFTRARSSFAPPGWSLVRRAFCTLCTCMHLRPTLVHTIQT